MEDNVSELISLARSFKNVVLEGPPGTGKTHVVGKVADSWQEATGRELGGDARGAWALTLHPSTAYEDFIEGLRSTEDGRFRVMPGFLLQKIAEAERQPDKDFLLLLDELNRANVPRLLGDTLMVMEADKRRTYDEATDAWNGGMSVALVQSGSSLSIPDNLYIFATMNTTDRSVAGIDSALRRRFAFVRVDAMGRAELTQALGELFVPDVCEALSSSVDALDALNGRVLRTVFGSDFTLGHSYLFAAGQQLQRAHESLPPLPPEVLQRADELSAAGTVLTDVFWVQVGEATGERRNQIDLSMTGQLNTQRGSIHYFLPSVGTAAPKSPVTRSVKIDWEGDTYLGSELKFYSGSGANGTWRLNLRGQSGSRNLGEWGVSHFRQHVLLFFRIASDHYSMLSLPISTVSALAAVSDTDNARNSTRRYGRLPSAIFETPPADKVIHDIWRYAILPQLADLVAAQGAEELMDVLNRDRYLDARADVPELTRIGVLHAALEFDAFIRTLGLELRADGSGLSRTLVCVRLPPLPEALEDDAKGPAGDASAL